jgi:tetratricopeptide (TPR) repeat protein
MHPERSGATCKLFRRSILRTGTLTTLSTTLIVSALALMSVCVRAADVGEAAYQPLPGDDKQPVDHLMQQGQAAAGRQDWAATIRYYTAAHHVAPQNPEPLLNLGLATSQLPGRELKAMVWFEAFLEAAPTDPRAPEVRRQIGRLRDGARAHALRLFAVTEKAVTPLQPNDRVQPAIALATTAARLHDGDLVIRWLADWGDDLYHGSSSKIAVQFCLADDVRGYWDQGFTKVIDAAGTAPDARASARSWEINYLTAALNNKGPDSVAGRCAPKPDDKPKLKDVSFALGEIAKADLELGRTQEVETLLRKLQALFDANRTDRADLIPLIGLKIAMGKRADAETDLRAWYAIAQAGDFFSLRDQDGRVAVDDWLALGDTAEARRVIDLYQSAATKSAADIVSIHTQNPPTDELLKYETVLSEVLVEEDQTYIAVMRLAIAAGDFSRATDALDHAWQAARKGQTVVFRFATTHPRNKGAGEERDLSDHFYDATLELGRALRSSGNQAELDALIGTALARARIEQQDEARFPPLPALKEYNGSMIFPDRGVVRAGALQRKLSNLMKLVALSRDRSKVPQYADFIRSVLPRGDNAATLIELADLELRTSGAAAAQPDLLMAVSDIEHCNDKLYACDGNGSFSSWSSGPGLLLMLPKGEALLADHVRSFQRSFVWKNMKSPPTVQHYSDSLRAEAARLAMDMAFDALESSTALQRAQVWADYAEWAMPGYTALDDRNFIGETVSTTENALGNATFSWYAINRHINEILDGLAHIDGKYPPHPGT